MIVIRVKTKKSMDRVRAKVKQGSFKSLGHAGAAIRLAARRSIRRRKTASMPGSAPSTRRGRLKQSIRFAVDTQRGVVLIGPAYDIIGTAGKAHEFGGRYRRETYPKRPFMGPALEKVKDRLPKMWANSVRS
jgi:phage gpG-like protein